ncbi:hypothetical protein BDR26DRAFT_943376 [Obelidium mucronatum]|nr:hypothetical protein BDR26DRAFT_943376 [Obelidium mucronatum]
MSPCHTSAILPQYLDACSQRSRCAATCVSSTCAPGLEFLQPLVAYLTGVVESLVHREAFEMVANITKRAALLIRTLFGLLFGKRFGVRLGPNSGPNWSLNRTGPSVRPNGTPNGLQLSSECASNWIYSS